MRYLAVFFFALFLSCIAFGIEADSLASYSSFIVSNPKKDPCMIKGRVKIVDSFEDISVKIVDSFEDLEVTVCEDFLGNECGRIMVVDDFVDVYIKIVDSFPDVTIKFKDEKSKDIFIKQLTKPK